MPVKHNILVDNYNDFYDLFECRVFHGELTEPQKVTIPAFLMQVIAKDVCDEVGSYWPLGLVGVGFSVISE